MRKIHTQVGRLSALTARLASPFFHPIAPSESSVQRFKGPVPQKPGTSAPRSNREYSDAAIRLSRTLW